MISAIKPTTRRMPHTIPALKIPSTTEQLPKPKTKKQASRKIIDLIPFFLSNLLIPTKSHTFFLLHEKTNDRTNILRIMGNAFYNLINRLLFLRHLDAEPGLSYNLHHRLQETDNKVRPQQVRRVFSAVHHFRVSQLSSTQNLKQ